MFNSDSLKFTNPDLSPTSFSATQLSGRAGELSIEVKSHLDKTFLETHSISSLATYFGTNTSKLMAVFRQTFGMTIFKYLHELRMQYAKSLLSDKGYYVAEVAREVGYKNAHHFSTAFKKKHGFRPSTLRSQV